jgi:hypothetical protein
MNDGPKEALGRLIQFLESGDKGQELELRVPKTVSPPIWVKRACKDAGSSTVIIDLKTLVKVLGEIHKGLTEIG